jgi:hypothetical protein
MHLLGCDVKNLAGATRNADKQLREIVGVQPVQRAPQTVITGALLLVLHLQLPDFRIAK